MNIKKIYQLLTDLGISTIATDTSLEPDAGQGENIYKLRKKHDAWEFVYIQYEKQDGKEDIKTTFKEEHIASKFYFLYELNSCFFRNYTQPFKMKNQDIFKGIRKVTLNKLTEAFRRLDIPNQYYSLDGTMKNHSFVLEEITEKKSKVKFINKDGSTLEETMVLENWLAYNSMYQDVYKLYLFDKYYQSLIENDEVQHQLTDEDYKMFLSPASYYTINQ